jgi:hypothetical protein
MLQPRRVADHARDSYLPWSGQREVRGPAPETRLRPRQAGSYGAWSPGGSSSAPRAGCNFSRTDALEATRHCAADAAMRGGRGIPQPVSTPTWAVSANFPISAVA